MTINIKRVSGVAIAQLEQRTLRPSATIRPFVRVKGREEPYDSVLLQYWNYGRRCISDRRYV